MKNINIQKLFSYCSFLIIYPRVSLMVLIFVYQVLIVNLASFKTLISEPSIILLFIAAHTFFALSIYNFKHKFKKFIFFGVLGLFFQGAASHILFKVYRDDMISSFIINS